MKDTFYFSHDFNARNDPKLQEVLMEHGPAGIGIYWCIVEQLYEQDGKLPLTSIRNIAYNLHADFNMVESVVKEFELFENDGKNFWSNSVNARLAERNAIAEKRRQNAQARWKKKDAKAKQMQCNCNTSAMQDVVSCNAIKESKGKENKEKEIDNTPLPPKGESGKHSDLSIIPELWNEICGGVLPKVAKLTDSRKRKIKTRLHECGAKTDEEANEWAKALFKRVADSRFLTGQNNNSWTATFDWLFENPTNWIKVSEGNYDNDRGAKNTHTAPNVQLGVGEFLRQDGSRTYGTGRVDIPMDAPPRPSTQYYWNVRMQQWSIE